MKAEDVYKGVSRFVYNHDFKLQNVFVHSWEADSFSVTSSNYSYEIEVKCSRSDFFADFKKPKHNLFKAFKKGIGVLNKGESWIGSPRIYHTNIDVVTLGYKNSPNKFFYACPVGMIEAHEVPEYAGLIWIMDTYSEPRIIKKAPYLHKNHINVPEMLFSKYYYMTIEQKNKIFELERDLEYYKDKANAILHPET
jgi:hypothetical protein